MPASIADGQPKNMPIITHICDNVKEYIENGVLEAKRLVTEGIFKCPKCFAPLVIHSSYKRSIRETGEQIEIVVVRCKKRCEKGQALLPDFILPRKQYSVRKLKL